MNTCILSIFLIVLYFTLALSFEKRSELSGKKSIKNDSAIFLKKVRYKRKRKIKANNTDVNSIGNNNATQKVDASKRHRRKPKSHRGKMLIINPNTFQKDAPDKKKKRRVFIKKDNRLTNRKKTSKTANITSLKKFRERELKKKTKSAQKSQQNLQGKVVKQNGKRRVNRRTSTKRRKARRQKSPKVSILHTSVRKPAKKEVVHISNNSRIVSPEEKENNKVSSQKVPKTAMIEAQSFAMKNVPHDFIINEAKSTTRRQIFAVPIQTDQKMAKDEIQSSAKEKVLQDLANSEAKHTTIRESFTTVNSQTDEKMAKEEIQSSAKEKELQDSSINEAKQTTSTESFANVSSLTQTTMQENISFVKKEAPMRTLYDIKIARQADQKTTNKEIQRYVTRKTIKHPRQGPAVQYLHTVGHYGHGGAFNSFRLSTTTEINVIDEAVSDDVDSYPLCEKTTRNFCKVRTFAFCTKPKPRHPAERCVEETRVYVLRDRRADKTVKRFPPKPVKLNPFKPERSERIFYAKTTCKMKDNEACLNIRQMLYELPNLVYQIVKYRQRRLNWDDRYFLLITQGQKDRIRIADKFIHYYAANRPRYSCEHFFDEYPIVKPYIHDYQETCEYG